MATTYPEYGVPHARQHAPQAWNSAPTSQYPAYPPVNSTFNSNDPTFNVNNNKDAQFAAAEAGRNLARTPSPTPSELKELKTGAINWKAMTNWRFWIRREWLWYYVAFVLILTITALTSIYHKQIVEWLTPVTKWLHDLKFGWLVPIGILFVISFPPLFGHEIVAVLCGLVWGLWIGFAIVCAGTFIGEVGNFYAFKYCCRARGAKMERTKMTYACLAKVVRDGGFKIALIARLSAIPGHFTTAVFSTCGMGIFTFSLAAILSLPKQFITVYLGVILEESSTGKKDTKSAIISDTVLAVTFLITIGAMWYILRQMNKVKPQIIYERRKARQAKLARPEFAYANPTSSDSSVTFNANRSDSDIPLTAPSKQRSFHAENLYNQNGAGQQNIVYAPRPTQPIYPEDYNHYGYNKGEDLASEESHESTSSTGHTHTRGYAAARQSTDDVGWDTGAYYANQSPTGGNRPTPPGIVSNQYTRSPPPMEQQPAQGAYQHNRSPHQQHQVPQALQLQHSQTSYAPQTREVNQTPTQAQYASYDPPHPSSRDVTSPFSGPLPTPPYPASPFDDPPNSVPSTRPAPAQQSQHVAEPTEMSYHTAMGSTNSREPSDASSETYHSSHEERVHSPPPPSYRTNLR